MKQICLLMICTLLCHVHAVDEQALYKDNVIIALDTSGSMEERMHGSTRMKVAKQALHTVSKQLSPTTQVGLYIFGGKNTGWLYSLGPMDGQKLTNAINRAQPSGGTPLGISLVQCGNALLKQREQQLGYGTYRLLVVTDGEASDPEIMERVIPQVLARGITLDAIGLDMGRDHSLATKVHNYRRADDQQSLTQAIAASFAEVSDDNQQGLDEMFAELAGLDAGIASAAISAYARSGNLPINPNARPGATATNNQQPSGATSKANTTTTATGSDGGGTSWGIIIIGICAVIVISKLKNLISRGR